MQTSGGRTCKTSSTYVGWLVGLTNKPTNQPTHPFQTEFYYSDLDLFLLQYTQMELCTFIFVCVPKYVIPLYLSKVYCIPIKLGGSPLMLDIVCSKVRSGITANFIWIKVKEQSFFSNNFILLNHIQVCFITIYDGCLT